MKIFTTLIFITLSVQCFGQLSFLEVLSLENKSYKEIQAFMLEKYTIIDDSKEYYYFPIKECNPPQYDEESCQWTCVEPNHLDVLRSKYLLKNVVFEKSSNKNYEVWKTVESSFGENYNSKTKRAKTFIEISERSTWSNNNCHNELRFGAGLSIPINITIQFSDPDDWKSFKSSVVKNATFQETSRLTKDSPIKSHYGIRRNQMKNGSWKGVHIVLYESDSTYHSSISFDSWAID
jgi:hypothetical protein